MTTVMKFNNKQQAIGNVSLVYAMFLDPARKTEMKEVKLSCIPPALYTILLVNLSANNSILCAGSVIEVIFLAALLFHC